MHEKTNLEISENEIIPLTGVRELNQYIFYFLNIVDLQRLRETCKELKQEVDTLFGIYLTFNKAQKKAIFSDYIKESLFFKPKKNALWIKNYEIKEKKKNEKSKFDVYCYGALGLLPGALFGLIVGIVTAIKMGMEGWGGFGFVFGMTIAGEIFFSLNCIAGRMIRNKCCSPSIDQLAEQRKLLLKNIEEAPISNFKFRY